MFSKLIIVIFATSPVLTSVLKELINSCSIDEFQCGDGTCVSVSEVCDRVQHCMDGSDEASCHTGIDSLYEDTSLHRSKRQASTCRKDQFKCRDGSCISFDGKCDGIVDCPDRSDETHALCRNTRCQYNLFRCTYGACVDGTAPCNNITECADNSDELLPRCRNEPDVARGQFKCLDGSTIPATNHCDGVKDCPDGSDETVRACGAKFCPSNLFQCAYGACVDQGADCNKEQECADGSDEADDLCNTTSIVTPKPITPPPSGSCILPPQPEHGRYVSNRPNALPGQAFESVTINVTCQLGYGVIGSSYVYCFNDIWSEDIPKCVRMCLLNLHPSVEYRCQVPDVTGYRICRPYEPSGTEVDPICRAPNYYSAFTLTLMHCREGIWDYVARCSPECGKVTPQGFGLIIGGRPAKRGEISWHAGIYTKTVSPYKQICGGSIISNTIVISAAHCFWSNALKKLWPHSNYAVSVGNLYRAWKNPQDTSSQKSDVLDIKIPTRYQGSSTNLQDDIAVVLLITPITYETHVRPVCVNFDINFESQQLKPGRIGKVAGWGLTGENGPASMVLKVVDLPYIDIQKCIDEVPPDFKEYITGDKICAGSTNGSTALCQGDSGGGLVFNELERGVQRYYLRGIVSTAPRNESECNAFAYTTFTQLLKHEHFVKKHWNDL